jgi:hypothetical protein
MIATLTRRGLDAAGACDPGWPAVVAILADEVRAHLMHRELDGRSVALPGRGTARFAAVYVAREALRDVESCRRAPVERGITVSVMRWRELTEVLRILEEAAHAWG